MNRYASLPAAVLPGLATGAGARAFGVSRGLLLPAYLVYCLVVVASVLGLAPLGSRLAALSLLLIAALASLLCLRALAEPSGREAAEAGAPPWSSSSRLGASAKALDAVGTAALSLGIAATAVAFALALLLPIGAYDALGYRLPAVAQWLDGGALHWVSGDDPLRNGYPLGLEAIEAVLFRALDSAATVDCVASFFVLAGAASLAGLAREVGALRSAALLSAALFLLVPVHLLNAPSGYADAAFSGALVAAMVAAARFAFAPHGRRALLVDLGVALALVTALKPHGFAFAALTLLFALAVRSRRVALTSLLQQAALLLALLSPGLFFAFRNVVRTGNPLYPLEVRAFGRLWLRGESSLDAILTPAFNVPRELLALPSPLRPLWVWLQPHGPARSFDDRLAGFGYAFALVALPTLAWFSVQWVRRAPADLRSRARGHASTRDALRAVGFVLLLTLACWLVQPLSFWPRFSSWLWGVAALALALLVSKLAHGAAAREALAVSLFALALALPEAVHALVHVKNLRELGLGVLGDEPLTKLARVTGIERAFLQRALVGRSDLCRTPWRLGTDDANIDGVVAQLAPRPRMHVLDPSSFGELASGLRAHGCSELIAIADHPITRSVPAGFAGRIEPAIAFGRCHLISLSSAPGVTP